MATLRGFPAQNVVAVFDEATGGGARNDYVSPRNRPARDPQNWIDRVYWHIDFFQYQLAMPIQTVNVPHPVLAGRTQTWGYGTSFTTRGDFAASNHTLVNHGLGYVPLAFVVYDGRMVMPGTIVQNLSEGRSRSIAPYASGSVVGLREVRMTSQNDLPAVSRSYQVMIFSVPAAEASRPLFGREGDNVVIGRGKIDTSRQYLRSVAPGESPFIISRDRTVDIRNGRSRTVIGGQTVTETEYNGSFTGTDFLTVGV